MQDAGPSDVDPSGRDGERGQAAKILAIQNRVLRQIASGKPFEQVLAALVEAVEAFDGRATASILLMDEDGEHLRHGAAPRLPESYNRAVDGLRIGPRAGSCGTAAWRGEAVVVEDIANDPLWEDYRALAAAHGLRACWSQPILSAERKVLGTFALYHAEPRRPGTADLEYVRELTYLAGIAIERQRTEIRRRAAERRLLEQKTALVELAKSEPLAASDVPALCRLAAEVAAETLDVERIGVWLFSDDRTTLRCEELYERSLERHSSGAELESSRYPRYFAALERGRSVVAHDACLDPDTSEFAASYLTPLGIRSMLDAPIRRGGRLVGVVCHEHVGPRRVWAADEQDFGASIGDFLALALEAAERRRAEQAFRSAQEELLRQDFQARRQIEFELGRIKDELVRQTRLATIGQIAASIAHELRNPLGAIRNAAYFLRRRVPADQPKWSEYLGIVEQEIRRADVTINDLLELSRPRAPVKQPADLAQLARDAFEYVRSGDAVKLRLDLDPDPFVVEADPGQLRQVLTNLLHNATEAMEQRGQARIEARREEGFDVVTVIDEGPGIPQALRSRVFEPLVTTKVKGTGLGLPICRQLVERHGGTIEVVDGPERGAALRLRLPRRAASA